MTCEDFDPIDGEPEYEQTKEEFCDQYYEILEEEDFWN